jgi:acetyl-CoA carboxylase carboxyltransferase component
MADRNESLAVNASSAGSLLTTKVDPTSAKYEANMRFLADLMSQVRNEGERICEGGGSKAIENQHAKGRLTARERIGLLADPGSFFELGLYAAHGMYGEWGGAPAAGVITGMARIHTRMVMVIANDATVKAGAFFPMTSKKVIRAQNIAIENRIPTVYLVDSAGAFLPLQEDVFPDTDDFGRVFRNNAVMSAMGIPQIAAIMGMCVAGGGYLPVMCDHVLMTDGSGLFLAGPALVQAAIGQKVSAEELGGAAMHSAISVWNLRSLAGSSLRHERSVGARARWQPLRRIQARVRKDAALRLWAHRGFRRRHCRQPENACATDRS